jgi:hypothetical protein
MTLDKYIHTPKKEEPQRSRARNIRDIALITGIGMAAAYGLGKLDTHLNDPDREQHEIKENYETTSLIAGTYNQPSQKKWETINTLPENYK